MSAGTLTVAVSVASVGKAEAPLWANLSAAFLKRACAWERAVKRTNARAALVGSAV
jgi:hypothetical protein